jgi:hypothetical protein
LWSIGPDVETGFFSHSLEGPTLISDHHSRVVLPEFEK